MERLKYFMLLFIASTTIHDTRGEDEATSTNLHEYIKRQVHENIQRALTQSDEKHAAQIALLREENELRVQQVKDVLSQKHADDMAAIKNEFQTQIRDLNLRLEMVSQIVEKHVNTLETADRPIHEGSETFPDKAFDNSSRSMDNSNRISEESNTPSGMVKKSAAASRINRRRDHQIDNALKRAGRQETEGTRVAFFAGMDATNHNLGENDDIVFEHVFTNIGSAYNSHHGIFIAPVDGVYVFSCTLENLNAHTRAHMMVNGDIAANFDLDHTNNLQASHTIVVSLKKGHDVSVQNSVLGRTISGDHHSTFSGFLLYEEFSDTPIIVG